MVGEVVSLDDAEGGVDGDVGFGAQAVPDPADAQFADVVDTLEGGDGCGGLVDEFGVDSV